MLEIIGKEIMDDRFLKLLRGMLKAGYVEDWRYHNTYSGTPQGNILSPLLANIVLNELDQYVEEVLIPEYTKGKVKSRNPDYRKLQYKKEWAKKTEKKWIWDKLTKEMRKMPCKYPDDPHYRRLRYVRYADDSLLAKTCKLCGNKTEVEGHHLRKLKDLKRRWKGHKESPEWVKRMIALHRKSLFVCKECHNKIHAGIYDGKKLAKSLLESGVSGKLAGTVRREVFGKVPV